MNPDIANMVAEPIDGNVHACAADPADDTAAMLKNMMNFFRKISMADASKGDTYMREDDGNSSKKYFSKKLEFPFSRDPLDADLRKQRATATGIPLEDLRSLVKYYKRKNDDTPASSRERANHFVLFLRDQGWAYVADNAPDASYDDRAFDIMIAHLEKQVSLGTAVEQVKLTLDYVFTTRENESVSQLADKLLLRRQKLPPMMDVTKLNVDDFETKEDLFEAVKVCASNFEAASRIRIWVENSRLR